MSEPFVGEIRMFAGNFAPRSHAFCDGQLLSIPQNDALFSLLGTIYGGDGRTTFGLPDLRGRVPIHAGTGPGLTQRPLGNKSGTERNTLTMNQLATHAHALQGTTDSAGDGSPIGRVPATTAGANIYNSDAAPTLAPMDSEVVGGMGGNQPVNNLMPFVCISFIIALFGVYPSRN